MHLKNQQTKRNEIYLFVSCEVMGIKSNSCQHCSIAPTNLSDIDYVTNRLMLDDEDVIIIIICP